MATAIAVALLAALTEGQARSALLGGGIGLVANGYSAWRVFAGPVKTSAEATLANLYRAEFGKLVITGALCALAFALIEELTAAGLRRAGLNWNWKDETCMNAAEIAGSGRTSLLV